MKRGEKFRASSLEERKKFYEEEFDIEKVKKWFADSGMRAPQLCAVDAGSETGIILNKKWKESLFYFPFNELKKKIEKYMPEDVYYDRNIYSDERKVLRTLKFNDWKMQELVFDIDADDISCGFHKSGRVCYSCIGRAFQFAMKMKRELMKDFKKIGIVYSGAGFHVHVFDKKAFLLSSSERKKLNEKFSSYPIDPWVSDGDISLIRMPFSLNSRISRKVLPIENLKFNKIKTYPRFLS